MKKFNDLKIRLSSILVLLALIGWSSSSFAQWQTNGNKIYYNNGFVGIGESDPAAHLDVTGTIRATDYVIPSSGSGIEMRYWPSESTGYLLVYDRDLSQHKDLAINHKGGNVGIGTYLPQEKLHVSNGNIYIDNSNNGLILTSPDGQKWKVTIDNSGTLSATQSTKVLEVENENDVNIYPNPTENKVTIDLKTNEIQNITTELYDISGKLVYMKSYRSNSINLDLNCFETGTYILKVKDENGNIIKTEKVMKK